MSPPRRDDDPTLELKIISAKDISHDTVTDKMDIYGVVSITGNNSQNKQAAKTPIDYNGGSNPRWNRTVKFSVNEKAAGEGQLTLTVKLFSYWLESENDLYLGEVNVWVHEFLDSTNQNNNHQWKSVTYPVEFRESTKGTLSLSYRFKPVNDPVYLNRNSAKSNQPVVDSPQFKLVPEKLTLNLLIKSAKNIRSAGILNEMSVYAKVMICEDNKVTKDKIKTPTVSSAYSSPTWNHPVTFSVNEKLVREGRLTLDVKLIRVRQFLGETELGVVKVSIQRLFELNPPSCDDTRMNLVTESVTDSDRERGTLNLAYRFNFEEESVVQPIIGNLGYMSGHLGGQTGPSNGLMPIYMQPHGYKPYLQEQLQTQLQTQSGPTVQVQGGSNAALVLGGGILGRVIGGALGS